MKGEEVNQGVRKEGRSNIRKMFGKWRTTNSRKKREVKQKKKGICFIYVLVLEHDSELDWPRTWDSEIID
jgi:hypothetical protein